MVRLLVAATMLGAPIAAIAANDLKVSQLEQDVRDLQRQVRAQSQQIEALRAQLLQPADRPVTSTSPTIATPGPVTWLEASRWQQLQAGMSELQVISSLGPPTSMREKGGDRVLMYALEIGSSGFLSGSVTLHDRVVVDVQKPALR
jgi:outer membrane murein-binding lipoprotein Lpp